MMMTSLYKGDISKGTQPLHYAANAVPLKGRTTISKSIPEPEVDESALIIPELTRLPFSTDIDMQNLHPSDSTTPAAAAPTTPTAAEQQGVDADNRIVYATIVEEGVSDWYLPNCDNGKHEVQQDPVEAHMVRSHKCLDLRTQKEIHSIFQLVAPTHVELFFSLLQQQDAQTTCAELAAELAAEVASLSCTHANRIHHLKHQFFHHHHNEHDHYDHAHPHV